MMWIKDSVLILMKLKTYFSREIGIFLLLLCCIPAAGKSSFPASDHVKLALITDIHFLDSLLISDGVAYRTFEQATGRNVSDLHAVLDVVWNNLYDEKPDFLLVAGDITNHGEKQSHVGFIEKLQLLQAHGIRILVIPGNHDVNIPDAKSYLGDKAISTKSISKKEFTELYAPFGYANAVQRDDASLSYLSEITETVWLLCLDTNRYDEHTTTSISSGRILPETMEWALGILKDAKKKGITVLGMMHHGLVEHLPYQAAFFPQYLVDDWKRNADILADAGLKVVFTGHFHANDITMHTSSKGNIIYDIETASLAQYPFAYRIMTLEDDSLSINSHFITAIPSEPSLGEKYQRKLEVMTRGAAKKRLEGLGMPISNESVEALVDLIVKLNLIHVKGDETLDPEIMSVIRNFASVMGVDAVFEEFSLDFPPQDNTITISLSED